MYKKVFCLVLNTGTIVKDTIKHPAKTKTGLLLYIVFLVYKKLRNFNTKQTNYQLFKMSGFSSNPKLAFAVSLIDMAPFQTGLFKKTFFDSVRFTMKLKCTCLVTDKLY